MGIIVRAKVQGVKFKEQFGATSPRKSSYSSRSPALQICAVPYVLYRMCYPIVGSFTSRITNSWVGTPNDRHTADECAGHGLGRKPTQGPAARSQITPEMLRLSVGNECGLEFS